MRGTPGMVNKGTDLEPIAPWEDQPRDRRSQLELFLSSDAPEATEVRAAVDEMLGEYDGFINRIAEEAGATDTRKPGFRENAAECRSGIERITRFAVWRALVNRERLMTSEPILPGHPSRIPRVIDDGEGGFIMIRSERPAEVSGEVETYHAVESELGKQLYAEGEQS